MLVFLIVVFLAIHSADLALTLRGTALGKRERNPVARFLMRCIGRVPGLVSLKLASVAVALLLVSWLPLSWQLGSLAGFSLLGLLVVWSNIGVLRRARRRAARSALHLQNPAEAAVMRPPAPPAPPGPGRGSGRG